MSSCNDWNEKNEPPKERVFAPGEHFTDFDNALSLYNTYRAYIRIEHELENERSTWHHVIQGFLFATLGVIGEWQSTKYFPNSLSAERHLLPFLLAAVGVLIAFLALRSIWAAEDAIKTICGRWEDVAKYQIDEKIRGLLPSIRGGGHKTAHSKGSSAARWIPIIIIAAWIGVFGMFGWDIFHQRSQPSQPTTAATIPTVEFHPCSQMIPPSQVPTQQELMSEIVCSQESSTLYREELQSRYGIQLPPTIELPTRRNRPLKSPQSSK